MIRDQVLEVRQKVDTNHLQYQNLLYESIHLQKEISKCADFKSKMDEIDLISREELFKSIESEQEKKVSMLTLFRHLFIPRIWLIIQFPIKFS